MAAVTLDPTLPPDSETPRLGAQRIRNLTAEVLELFGFTGTVPETVSGPPFSMDASGNITLNGQPLTVNDPTTALGVANKEYVDAAGISSGTATGVNTLTVTLTPVPATLAALTNKLILLSNTSANTGAATLNANSSGAVAVLKEQNGTLVPLVAGDLPAGAIVLLSYDGTEYQLLGSTGNGPVIAYKPTDQAITSSVVLVNDSALLVSIGANQSWNFEIELYVTAGAGANNGGLQVQLNGPTGSAIVFSSSANSSGQGYAGSTPVEVLANGSGITTYLVKLFGVIINGSTAGTLQLQIAQQSSVATPTTVKAGSTLSATLVNP